MGFQHNGREGFRGNLRMDQTVQGMVEQNRVRLLTHQAGAVLQPQMPDVIPQQIFHVARAGEEKAGFRQATHHLLRGFEKNPLALPDRKIESSNHAKGHICFVEIQLSSGCRGEGGLFGLEQGGVDPGVDDMKFGRVDPAGGSVMPFGHGGGGIVVSMPQHMGDKARHGDDRIGLGKKMATTEGRTRTFCEVTGKNKQGSGLDESGSKEGRPVVVAMVGMKNSGADFFQQFGKGEDLQRAEAGQPMKREGMGLWAKRSLRRSCNFDGPSPRGKSVGEGKTLCIRATAPESGVKLENPAGEVRSGH